MARKHEETEGRAAGGDEGPGAGSNPASPPLEMDAEREDAREARGEGRAWDPGPAGDQTWDSDVRTHGPRESPEEENE